LPQVEIKEEQNLVEVNISIEVDDDIQLRELLNHITKEITDSEYRKAEIQQKRKVDLNWVYVDVGRYQWAKNDRT
jgi:hypothetical protein